MLTVLPTHCGVATYPPGATFGPRLLQDYEFVWVIEGDVQYRWGETAADAPAGSLILCRPGATDFFQWDRHRRTRHAYVHFQLAEALNTTGWPLVRALPKEDIVRPLFRHLLTWTERESEEQRGLTVTHILSAFLANTMTIGAIGRKDWPEAVEAACNYLFQTIETDPARPISLPQLADVASVTPEHLCRLFASSIGYSPARTVRLARLDYAASLLARTNYSIGEISALVGFHSPYHFSRLFRQAFGQTATEVRRALEAGSTPPLSRLLRSVNSIDPDL